MNLIIFLLDVFIGKLADIGNIFWLIFPFALLLAILANPLLAAVLMLTPYALQDLVNFILKKYNIIRFKWLNIMLDQNQNYTGKLYNTEVAELISKLAGIDKQINVINDHNIDQDIDSNPTQLDNIISLLESIYKRITTLGNDRQLKRKQLWPLGYYRTLTINEYVNKTFTKLEEEQESAYLCDRQFRYIYDKASTLKFNAERCTINLLQSNNITLVAIIYVIGYISKLTHSI